MKFTHVIFIALISSLVALGSLKLADRFGLGAPPVPLQPAFARVMQTGEIRCAYGAGTLSASADPDSNVRRGIAYDIMTQVGRILKLKIVWNDEIAAAEAAAVLADGRDDVMCMNLWPTGPRAGVLDFTAPIDYAPVYAYARADDARFDGDPARINDSNVTIAVIDGDISKIIADEDDPLAKQYALTTDANSLHLLLAVTTKKADIVFADPLSASDFMKNYPGTLKPVANVGPARVFGDAFAVAKGETKLRDMIDLALRQMNQSGFIRMTLDRYLGDRKGQFFYPAKPWEP